MTQPRSDASAGRLHARPAAPTTTRPAPGVHRLPRGGQLLVPATASGPLGLIVALHGAGGQGEQMTSLLQAAAQRQAFAVLAPDSRASTWDVITGGFGPDVRAIDLALADAFACLPVDPARMVVAGFSDGASYALSLGLTNGDLFPRVLAYSPGFAAPGEPHGRPQLFLSHGTADRVLPISRCSRVLVPRLQRAGYDVRYREFDGGHVVPADVVEESLSDAVQQRD